MTHKNIMLNSSNSLESVEENKNNEGEAIQVENLKKKYNRLTAVDGISFSVKKGEVFGFLGPNGAGKTTTMKMIQCVSPKTSGELKVFGLDVNHSQEEIKQVMGVVPQMDNLDPDFSVLGNLIQYSRYFDIPVDEAKKRANELIDYVQLNEKKDSSIDKLSGGMKRRLVLARAMINNPKLLILDEPTTGLDPQARRNLWELVKNIQARGTTVIITTHYMDEAEYLCDRVAIIDSGNIVAMDSPDKLIDNLVASGFERPKEMKLANLEDVFINLTGHSLREG